MTKSLPSPLARLVLPRSLFKEGSGVEGIWGGILFLKYNMCTRMYKRAH